MLPTTLGSAALGDDGGMPRATLVLAVLVGALTVAALPGCTTTTDPTEQGATTTTAGSSGGPTTASAPRLAEFVGGRGVIPCGRRF